MGCEVAILCKFSAISALVRKWVSAIDRELISIFKGMEDFLRKLVNEWVSQWVKVRMSE